MCWDISPAWLQMQRVPLNLWTCTAGIAFPLPGSPSKTQWYAAFSVAAHHKAHVLPEVPGWERASPSDAATCFTLQPVILLKLCPKQTASNSIKQHDSSSLASLKDKKQWCSTTIHISTRDQVIIKLSWTASQPWKCRTMSNKYPR